MRSRTYTAVRLANQVSVELPFERHYMKGMGQEKGETGTSKWELRGADKPRWSVSKGCTPSYKVTCLLVFADIIAGFK
jgi:hypothetical protein